jgi:hypothetical protein
MRNKFNVGEEILLQSKDFPECNGDYTIVEIVNHHEYGWIYKLDIHFVKPGWSDYWKESALRKKHTPGELSFEDLMFSLSSPKVLTHDPQ